MSNFPDFQKSPFAANSNADRINGRHFTPIRFKDIKFAPSPQELIKGFFPKDALIVIWGPPKCGKSFVVYDAAMHVAQGINYRGRHVLQGVVVYIACEGERGLKLRTEAYRQTLPDDADPPFYLLTTQLDLVTDINNLIEDIRATLGEQTPILIVIDTLNRSLNGSESEDKDMTAYIKAGDRLRQAFGECSLVLIHHCGVEGKRPRGHTSLTGAADAQIHVERNAEKNIVSTVEFMKDGDEGAMIASRLRVVVIGEDDNHDLITSCVIEPADDNQVTKTKNPLKPLSSVLKITLDALKQALDRYGSPSTDIPQFIPPGTIVVSDEMWRRIYIEKTCKDGQKEDTRRAAYRRHRYKLISMERACMYKENVWIPMSRE